jgi:hypothetical protein
MLFNLALSGKAMPNTFYAKQAEYELFWHSRPWLERISDYLWPIVASPFLAVVPGAWMWLIKRVRIPDWGTLASLIWVLGYIAIYFANLPAYQHGRYIIPAQPVMYLWGMLGFIEFVLSPEVNKRIVFLWQVVTVALSLAFTYIGAHQNAIDVFWIESEMVATARWVNQNIPSDARLAVHDIGALGFYVQNPIVDMAGLITPEVVPFIRDEPRLEQYLDSNSVDYFITFPSFYPQLTSERELLYKAGSERSLLGENMGVYRWR